MTPWQFIPHPENAPGDFYVTDGCCLLCNLPFDSAPDHFAISKDNLSCFVKRQPVTLEEIENMIDAVHVADASCVRYRGQNQQVLDKLASLNCSQQCDQLYTAPATNSEKLAKVKFWGKLKLLMTKK